MAVVAVMSSSKNVLAVLILKLEVDNSGFRFTKIHNFVIDEMERAGGAWPEFWRGWCTVLVHSTEFFFLKRTCGFATYIASVAYKSLILRTSKYYFAFCFYLKTNI